MSPFLRFRLRALVLAVALVFPIAVCRAEEAFVLDRQARSVTILDLSNLTPRVTVRISDAPDRALLSASGKILIVLSRGEGKDAWKGFRPSTKSAATLLDTATGKILSRSDLCWGLGPSTLTADRGSLLILCPGFDSKKPGEAKTAELVWLDADGGNIRRAAFERAASDVAISPDGKTALVLLPRGGEASAQRDAEIRFVGIPEMSVAESSVRAKGADYRSLLMAPDGKTAYAVAVAQESAFSSRPGSIAAIGLADRNLISELGFSAQAVLGGFDSAGRLYVADFASKVPEGRLQVIHAGAVVHSVGFGSLPLRILRSADERRVYVLHWGGIERIEFGDFTSMPKSDMVKVKGKFWGTGSFAITADEKRALVFFGSEQSCCKACVVDLDDLREIDRFTTGSFAARLALGLQAAAATVASYRSAEAQAIEHGKKAFQYTVYTARADVPRAGSLLLRDDGRVAYMIDGQTSEVTVIDMEKPGKLRNLSAGSAPKELILLPGGERLLVVADSGITVVDTRSQEKSSELKLDGAVYQVAFSPDGAKAVVLGRKRMLVLDSHSGQKIAESAAFLEPVEILVASSPR